ncbi:diaminopimelate decarboxylase [Reyranella sp. CPCC 100927]|uniref:diaminopimelate decarboxylase n=1 Tax=Reyranella sp. CPCC 100927 TaxID=2599616 RepID=UPI0011B44E55|nr:diaminopimelate decarboxylase [Reyranella sp. CPCC 100927]TWT13999.1 diaminopimelate decarboxylase [Reyranella sp. CPCC 100927]
MDSFVYQGGEMVAESVPLARIARDVGTPVYVYSLAALRANYQAFATSMRGLDAELHYAVKANSNLAVIRAFAAQGAGADIVSIGEMRRALAAGVAASNIVFSGVGKKEVELRQALEAGVRQINVESSAELDTLDAVAKSLGRVVDIAIRVNPDVDAKTHAKITTGRKGNKFGIDIDLARDAYAHAASKKNLRPIGVAMHIGSQILSLEPYRDSIRKLRGLVGELRTDGHDIQRLDLGGGYGIVYRDQSNERPFAVGDYMEMVREETAGLGCALSFEPGRSLVGNAGVLLGEVILVKPGTARTFVIIDAAMNDLIRPTLYEAWHDIVPSHEPAAGATLAATDIVGPICESGDYLAQNRPMPPLAAGDVVVVKSAGAYGAVMSSTYNTRPLVPEVLVDGDRYEVIRPRQSLDDLLAADRVPEWL